MKYAQGDYLTARNLTFQRVLAAIEQAAGPIYAMGDMPKDPKKIVWVTEVELDNMGLSKQEPDFDGFSKIQSEDIVKMGDRDQWCKVLARVGDVVLLSNTPNKEAHADLIELDKAIRGVTGDQGPLDEVAREHIKAHGSITKMHQEAADWWTVRQLALMNWTVVQE